MITGLASGWLGTVAFVVITCGAIYIGERRRTPRLALVLILGYVLFFQVGKEAFREMYWEGEAQAPRMERLSFWVNESQAEWESALKEQSADHARELVYKSLSRVSLLTQTANVLELTPSSIPFQGGYLYSYLGVTLIPRFLWREKPTVSEANQFYQVAYGITTEEALGSTAVAVGFLTESYISFGWLGVVILMYLVGIFLDFVQNFLLSKRAGLLLGGVGVVLLPYFLSVESQMAVYLGGFIQQVVLALLVFLPAIQFGKPSEVVPVVAQPSLQRER